MTTRRHYECCDPPSIQPATDPGQYVEVANVQGDEPFHAELPFPVTLVPAELVRP